MSDPQDSDSYGDYSVDAEDQPQGDESSTSDDRGLVDPLDEGYSPPEKWSAGQGWGNTALEEELGESFEQRLKQEEPEPDPYVEAEKDVDDLDDGEVGDRRSGRLIAPDEGLGEDVDSEMLGTDVGIDGAGASAEEAAMHEVEE
jgi:hypothetical protein